MKQIWWHDKVGYKIKKDFFTKDENGVFHIADIEKKMDYVKQLGVDCILMEWNTSWESLESVIFEEAGKRKISVLIDDQELTQNNEQYPLNAIPLSSCPDDHFYRQSAQLTLCLLQKGMPVITWGQELGLFDKVDPNCWERVSQQEQEYGSILNFTKRLISFRKSKEYKEIFFYGSFHPVYETELNIHAFERSFKNKSVQIICNFSDENVDLLLKEDYINIIFVNYEQVTRIGNTLKLKPYQIVTVELFISDIIFSDFLTK